MNIGEMQRLLSQKAEKSKNYKFDGLYALRLSLTSKWRAVCSESCKHGSEGGVGRRVVRYRAWLLPYVRHEAWLRNEGTARRMGQYLHRLSRLAVSRWGVATNRWWSVVKQLPLKCTREVRRRRPRGGAWLRGCMVNPPEAGLDLRERNPPSPVSPALSTDYDPA